MGRELFRGLILQQKGLEMGVEEGQIKPVCILTYWTRRVDEGIIQKLLSQIVFNLLFRSYWDSDLRTCHLPTNLVYFRTFCRTKQIFLNPHSLQHHTTNYFEGTYPSCSLRRMFKAALDIQIRFLMIPKSMHSSSETTNHAEQPFRSYLKFWQQLFYFGFFGLKLTFSGG